MTCTAPRRRIVFTGDILQTTLDGAPKMSLETHWLADLLRYELATECLRLVPVHQAAQALLARVHARALARG